MPKTPIVTPVEWWSEGEYQGVRFSFEQRILVTKPIPLSDYERDPRLPSDTVEVVAPDAKLATVIWTLDRGEVTAYIEELQALLDRPYDLPEMAKLAKIAEKPDHGRKEV